MTVQQLIEALQDLESPNLHVSGVTTVRIVQDHYGGSIFVKLTNG